MATRSETVVDPAVDGIRAYRRRLERIGVPETQATCIEARMLEDLDRSRRHLRTPRLVGASGRTD
jgi:hypothetical protein